MTTLTHQPTSTKERVKFIDVIRGFALFGVFLVNTVMFNDTMFTFFDSPVANPWQGGVGSEFIPALFVQVFGEGKFYTIFSFLFGLGFYMFISRANEKGLKGTKLFARRLGFLLLFGLLHFTFVWYGDILHTYAIIGFVMLLFANKKPKTILIWAIVFLSYYLMSIYGIEALQTYGDQMAAQQTQVVQGGFDMQAEGVEQLEIYKTASYLDVIGYRLSYEFLLSLVNLIFFGSKILGMFLLGLYFGKMRIFNTIHNHLPIVKRWLIFAGCLAFVTSLGFVLIQSGSISLAPVSKSLLQSLLQETSIMFMSMTYVSGLILLYFKGAFSKLFTAFGYVGQMALTNYLIQCILLSLIFYSHGLGLIGDLNTWTCVLITTGFYSLQLIYSPIWLNRNTYGPFEWVWRKLTYGSV